MFVRLFVVSTTHVSVRGETCVENKPQKITTRVGICTTLSFTTVSNSSVRFTYTFNYNYLLVGSLLVTKYTRCSISKFTLHATMHRLRINPCVPDTPVIFNTTLSVFSYIVFHISACHSPIYNPLPPEM